MPGCCLPGCANSYKNGFKFFRFPTNPIRRRRWVENVVKLAPTWKLTKTSCLCEAHFDGDQYEQHRLDGWKKLKPNAVPTIFLHTMRTRSRRSESVKSKAKTVKNHSKKSTNDSTKPKRSPSSAKKGKKSTNKRKTLTPVKRTQTKKIENSIESKRRHVEKLLKDNLSQILNGNPELPPGLKIYYRSPFEAGMCPADEHGYAREIQVHTKTRKHEIKTNEISLENNVGLVEVCFTNEENPDESVGENLNEESSEVRETIQACRSCVDLEAKVKELEKKIFCMNSAIRMVLDEAGRRTYGAIVNTIISNFQTDEQ